MTKNKIIKNLENALLQDAPLAIELYKWELEEHIQEYYQSKQQDKDNYFIAITEHTDHVAMLMIDKEDNLHINEAARRELKRIWGDAYERNMKKLIPKIAQNVFDGYLFAGGVKEAKAIKHSWQLPVNK